LYMALVPIFIHRDVWHVPTTRFAIRKVVSLLYR